MKVTNYMTYRVWAFLAVLFLTLPGMAQEPAIQLSDEEAEKPMDGVQFNGLGRVNLLQTGIDGEALEGDTVTPRNLTDGEFLLDLKVNARPNEKTEVQSILRLRNEFGGFFGAGQSVEVRELWARGIIADRVEYRVGDMDVEMSPYTFYIPEEEGTVNLPDAFEMQRELIYYEQFYTDPHSRRMQGAKLNFGLKFTRIIRDADFRGFIARVRGTDFFTVPTRWVSGGEARFNTMTLYDAWRTRAQIGFNLIHTFDDLQSGDANTGIRNTVYTVDFDAVVYENDKMRYRLFGEAGQSRLKSLNDSITFFTDEDFFVDAKVGVDLKEKNLSVYAGYSDVGPDFFSIGAQSKRVEFDAEQFYYDRIGQEQTDRPITLFDLSRDRAVYTYQLSDRLMDYDPRFSNTFPYGPATPNRRGLNYGADYALQGLTVSLKGAVMSEIRGQGTEELKDFALVRAAANVDVSDYLEWDNNLRLTLGYQFENTNRGGVELEQVDLTSNLVEAGIEIELFTDFELLFGAKLLQAEGSEYIPRIDEFNDVLDFPRRTRYDDTETLLAGGLKYTFKEGIYLTLQYQSFDASGREGTFRDYTLDQFFVLYTMNF